MEENVVVKFRFAVKVIQGYAGLSKGIRRLDELLILESFQGDHDRWVGWMNTTEVCKELMALPVIVIEHNSRILHHFDPFWS